MKAFAERLKELRIESGLTTKGLAEKIGVTDASISRWENELRVPSIENLYQLAIFFKVSADYLLGLED